MTFLSDTFILQNQDQLIAELFQFLKIPSVSTDSVYRPHIDACADYLVTHLQSIGLRHVTQYPTNGHPVVYADYIVSPNLPTLLIYGHYDVQPPDPLDLWESPPFEPQIRDGQIFARGVSDDKGQIFCHIKAVEAYLSQTQTLPINVKFLIEGEEEIGSPTLDEWAKTHTDLLKADAILVSDNPMFAKGIPSICYSLRGLCYIEIIATGANSDLHSGQHGGPAPNPINALCTIVSQLKNETGKVQIPHFYDAVRPIPKTVHDDILTLNFDDTHYKKLLGVSNLIGEPEFTSLEKRWFRPTLDCNGIIGGYTGEGSKTIIPSVARVKLSMRLVADQDPKTIFQLAKAYIQSICPLGISLEFIEHSGGKPVQTDTAHPAFQAGIRAIQSVYEKPPICQGEGGSIPIISNLQDILKAPSVMIGLNLPDDKIHAPNERFSLENYFNGIRVSIAFLTELAHSFTR